jgi:hypothetical protein
MPVKAIYAKEPELRLAVAALRELANAKVEIANKLEVPPAKKAGKEKAVTKSDIEDIRLKALHAAHQYLDAANSLQREVDGACEKATPDEEKAELKKIIDGLWEGVGYSYGGSLAEQVQKGVETVKRREKEAYGVIATMIDDQRVRLQALQWILEQALGCSTHKSKDSRLYLGLDSVKAIIDELQKIDKDNPRSYSAWEWHKGSLNTRKLNAEVYRKDRQISEMREEIDKLEGLLKLKSASADQEEDKANGQ